MRNLKKLNDKRDTACRVRSKEKEKRPKAKPRLERIDVYRVYSFEQMFN